MIAPPERRGLGPLRHDLQVDAPGIFSQHLDRDVALRCGEGVVSLGRHLPRLVLERHEGERRQPVAFRLGEMEDLLLRKGMAE